MIRNFIYYPGIVYVILISTANCQNAQFIDIMGSPNPVGSGARALGMGGAYIGIADDATAASWNPGCLIQLWNKEISFSISHNLRNDSPQYPDTFMSSGEYSIDLFDLNYLSVAYPFSIDGRHMIMSLNYQTLYDFYQTHHSHYYSKEISGGLEGWWTEQLNKKGYLKALSPAFAVQITPEISTGVSFNFFNKAFGCKFEKTFVDQFRGHFYTYPHSYKNVYKEDFDFNGENFTFGLLWALNPCLTIGAVYKTGFQADIHYKESHFYWKNDQLLDTIIASDEDQLMNMPSSYGVGFAIRFSDAASIDLDAYKTNWQDYYITQANGHKINPFTGNQQWKSKTKPTYQVRIGGEYLFISDKEYSIPFRCGFFYDPEPTSHQPDDFWGFSLGSGYNSGKFVFDMAYQFRWGHQVREFFLLNQKIKKNARQHSFYISIIYHLDKK